MWETTSLVSKAEARGVAMVVLSAGGAVDLLRSHNYVWRIVPGCISRNEER